MTPTLYLIIPATSTYLLIKQCPPGRMLGPPNEQPPGTTFYKITT